MGDRLAPQAFEQQASDRQNVRGEQGGQVEGQDSVESGGGPNVCRLQSIQLQKWQVASR